MRYMRLLTVLFLSLIFFKGYGQLKNAERAYDGMRYTEAIGYYQESMKRDSLSAASIAKLADSYDKTQQYTKALYWYDKLLTTRVADTAYRYRYGQLLAMDGQYKAAATQFKWVNSVKPDPQLESTVGLYEGGLNALLADSVNWQTALLNINSGYADFCPVTYGAGLVFVSDRPRNKVFRQTNAWTGGDFLTLYRVVDTARVKDAGLRTKELEQVLSYASKDLRNVDSRTESSWDSKKVSTNPQATFVAVPNQLSREMITPFNTKLNKRYHEGPVSFSRNWDSIIVTYNEPSKGKGDISRLRLQTYVMRYGDWIPQPAFPHNNKDYNVGQPALHPNGDVLFFTSDMPGGVGGKDIYYCRKSGNSWGPPMNAGPLINTSGNEMFPYIDPAGRLYFSSDKWPGLGGLDIFSVTLDSAYKPLSAPRNEGVPFNSSKNDFGMLMEANGNKGYFSSDRRGNDDIYIFWRIYPSMGRQ
ncbi:PD40 domain-containing protein [Chitinophaga pinensis]|uniref:WD40 domain protein beta Propeller n=1 Tax=Chitinophaga pinensis (strain ATCC 43595 / DSM 2588 / LMG 13176 / NBRC 15968 / NCIMB 11800 / UQM 2034) TaxID=485918 RepID=A0A979GQ49_CHIPD|nr:PD40 domain-containing protein [Chitinophaga pinensis]ACU61087.1 WD40 domain protein beta Propeller [Chitinophaga pinensis DSM 2588]